MSRQTAKKTVAKKASAQFVAEDFFAEMKELGIGEGGGSSMNAGAAAMDGAGEIDRNERRAKKLLAEAIEVYNSQLSVSAFDHGAANMYPMFFNDIRQARSQDFQDYAKFPSWNDDERGNLAGVQKMNIWGLDCLGAEEEVEAFGSKEMTRAAKIWMKNKDGEPCEVIYHGLQGLIAEQLSNVDVSMKGVFESGYKLNGELFPGGWDDFILEGDLDENKDSHGARTLLLLLYVSLCNINSKGVKTEVRELFRYLVSKQERTLLRHFGWILLGNLQSAGDLTRLCSLCDHSKETMLNDIFFAKKTPANAGRISAAPPERNCRALQTLSVLMIHKLIIPQIKVVEQNLQANGVDQRKIAVVSAYRVWKKITPPDPTMGYMLGYSNAVRNWMKELDGGQLRRSDRKPAPVSVAQIKPTPKAAQAKPAPKPAQLKSTIKPAKAVQTKPAPKPVQLSKAKTGGGRHIGPTQAERIMFLEQKVKEMQKSQKDLLALTKPMAQLMLLPGTKVFPEGHVEEARDLERAITENFKILQCLGGPRDDSTDSSTTEDSSTDDETFTDARHGGGRGRAKSTKDPEPVSHNYSTRLATGKEEKEDEVITVDDDSSLPTRLESEREAQDNDDVKEVQVSFFSRIKEKLIGSAEKESKARSRFMETDGKGGEEEENEVFANQVQEEEEIGTGDKDEEEDDVGNLANLAQQKEEEDDSQRNKNKRKHKTDKKGKKHKKKKLDP